MAPRPSGRPRVLAHLGLNHDGSLARALALVEAAASCGASGVALPLYFHEPDADAPVGESHVPLVEAAAEDLEACELRMAAVEHILRKARRLGLVTVLEPCDPLALMMAQALEAHALCLHLGQAGAIEALPELLGQGRRLFLLTSVADTLELARLREWITAEHEDRVILVCGAIQPFEATSGCLELTGRFFDRIGFCDTGQESGIARRAAASGADWILSYITLDRQSRGPGHYWARDREGLRRLCASLGLEGRDGTRTGGPRGSAGSRDSQGNHPHAS